MGERMTEEDTGYRKENYRLRRELVKKNEEIQRLKAMLDRQRMELVTVNYTAGGSGAR